MKKYIKSEIQDMVASGKTLKEIGFKYEVSRQRMYQILATLGIETLEKKRKSDFRELSEREKWAWKMINHKFPNTPKPEKLIILKSLNLPDKCPVLGIPLNWNFGNGTRKDDSPSLDRTNNDIKYTKDNIKVISWRANRIKNDGTVEEHEQIANYLRGLAK